LPCALRRIILGGAGDRTAGMGTSSALRRLWKISFRLPAIVVLATACAALAIGVFSYLQSSEEMHREATAKLVALRESRFASLTQYFQSIEEDLELLASNHQVIGALTDLRETFGNMNQADRRREEAAFRRVYTTETPTGDPDLLKGAGSAALIQYYHTHNRYHAWFQVASKLKGYYDLFLISPLGDVVYTVFKEADFASNLLHGKWRDTGLSRAFNRAIAADGNAPTAFVDFEPYRPSNDDPAAFIARKVVANGRTIGVLALQMPIGRINQVMQVTAGMGDTGETYIVGADRLMRSDSRFSKDTTILKTAVRTATVARALKGESGVDIVDDYRGIPVVSAFQPFNFLGAEWAIMAEKDTAEIQMPIDSMRDSVIFIGLGMTLLVAFGGMLLSRSITAPLEDLSRSIKAFRETHQPVDLSRYAGDDEIGEIARGFDIAAREVSDYIQRINQAREELRRNETEIRTQEARISAIMESVPDALITIDTAGRIQSANAAVGPMFGYAPGELIGRNVKVLMEPDMAERHDTHLARYLETGEARVIGRGAREVMAQDKDGTAFPVEVSVAVAEAGDDRLFVGVLRDITERKEAERQVEAQRAQLHDILDNVQQGIVLFDQDKRLVAWNPRYPDTLNIDERLLTPGLPLYDLTLIVAARGDYGDGGEPTEMARERVEQLWKGEYRADISFGDERSFDAHSNRTADGRLVIAYTDITERKEAERVIADAMAKIGESLQYASRIQRSVLPTAEQWRNAFADHMVIWEPRDVVGGDVYLLRAYADGHLLMLADCTGHGVPGAFMTMIVTGALDQAIIEIPKGTPAALLKRINQLVKWTLGQVGAEGESDDGLECGLCLVDEKAGEIIFAGARFALWSVTDQGLAETKGDKVGVGYRRTAMDHAFTDHRVALEERASHVMSSDGLIDQVGGDKRRAFGKRRLKEALMHNRHLDMAGQAEAILAAFAAYQGEEVRRDDISMVGFQVKR